MIKKNILDIIQSSPDNSGIYKFIKDNGEILYIGKAKNLKKRLLSYSRDDVPYRIGLMLSIAYNLEYIITKSEAEALLLEASLIKKIQPRYNILLKDDKSFPYIVLKMDHDYPMLISYRGKNLQEGRYFGPFTSTNDMNNTIIEMQKIFKIRNCSDNYFKNRTRACLQYQIKRCSAPCVNKISKEEYLDSFNQAKKFLQGKNQDLQTELAKQMELYSDRLEYEKAKEIRDRIRAISNTQMRSGENFGVSDADMIAIFNFDGLYVIQVLIYRAGFYLGNKSYFPSVLENINYSEIISTFIAQFYQSRIPPKNILMNIKMDSEIHDTLVEALYNLHKIKSHFNFINSEKFQDLINVAELNAKEALEKYHAKSDKYSNILSQVQELLHIEQNISRIEIFDNSHIMGSHAVGAMVVFSEDGFQKKEYRTYNIKISQDGDDYAMLKEVMHRRLKKIAELKSNIIPDLMIIDGGKGHLNIVSEIMTKYQLNIPFITISKGRDRNAGNETIHMSDRDAFKLDNDSDIGRAIQIMRDQAHSFAISTYRKKHRKSLTSSLIEDIEGVGEARRKSLMNYFGSYETIAKATIEDLTRVKGISKNLAKKILSILQGE